MNLNPWPCAIITVFILFALGTATLVTLACSQKMDLVSSNYYEQEILYQQQLEKMQRAERLAGPEALVYDPSTHHITISLRDFQKGALPGRIQLYRPSAAGLDQNIPLALNSEGRQSLDTHKLRPGLWKARLSWTAQGKEYFLERTVIIQ